MSRLIDADLLEKEIYKWMPKDMETWADSSIPPIEDLVVSIMMTIEEQPTVNEWIPVSERLPEVGQYVLVSTDMNYVATATFQGDYWESTFDLDWEEVVAWQPTPKPFEVKDDEKKEK